jgi:soluble lytic murein transglycosylase-like protein
MQSKLNLSYLFSHLLVAGLALGALSAHAGAQREEELAANVRSSLQRAVADRATTTGAFASDRESAQWLATMSKRLERRFPDSEERLDFLNTVHYEAKRAGLDPQLVLGLIQVESAFRKYAVSNVGASGYMQIMPFWVRNIGAKDHNLFHLRTNLRYGCTILRHYVDIERGDLFRALGRYNGSLGRAEYPTLVLNAWKNYRNEPMRVATADGAPVAKMTIRN